jgi:hypothetical protein
MKTAVAIFMNLMVNLFSHLDIFFKIREIKFAESNKKSTGVDHMD